MIRLLFVVALVAQAPKFPEPKVYIHNCNIVTRYDKFRNSSIFKVDLGKVVDQKDVNLSIELDYL